ncbi:MAG: hypothetical protein C0458_05795 [Methylobacterium sp.]|nr:hypothetical protein [Methylobacterium sp.]
MTTISKTMTSTQNLRTQWRAHIGGTNPFGYSSDAAFVWEGRACDEHEAMAKALKAVELALRAFNMIRQHPETARLPFLLSDLRVEPTPEASWRNIGTRALQVVGAPFIPKESLQAAFCFAKDPESDESREDDYRTNRLLKQQIERLLMLDDAVCQTIERGRLLQVRFSISADTVGSPSQPRRAVRLEVHDRDEVGIPLAEATVNAILMLLLAANGHRLGQGPFLYPGMPPYGLIERAQSAFRKARQRLVEKPDLRLLGTAWELLELGHADLAADIVAMAHPASRAAPSPTVNGLKMTDTKLAALLGRPTDSTSLN